MKALEDMVGVFSQEGDRQLLLLEARSDPSFALRLSSTLAQPDGEERVAIWARKAVLNELDPSLYPETRSDWKRLRKSLPAVFEAASRVVREGPPGAVNGLAGLGQWEIIGSIVGAVAGAASNVYSQQVQADTAKKIQQMQLDAQLKQIQAQQSIAQAQAAMAQAQAAQASPVQAAVSNVADALTQPVVAGIPLWAIGAAVVIWLFAEKA